MILILGHGNLGAALAKLYKAQNPLVLDRHQLDITDPAALKTRLTKLKPSLILNAAAFTDTAKAETTHRAEAAAVNTTAVGHLAQLAKKLGATLVHYSTDYVFDGQKQSGYRESDIPSKPLNHYGQTKLEGEKLLFEAFGLNQQTATGALNAGHSFYLIRTSWVFAKTTGFPNKMLELAQKLPELKVINDQHGKPTYAPDLAAATKDLLDDRAPFGIYHLTNEPAMTWYDLAQMTFKAAGLSPKVTPVSSHAFPSALKRPAYAVLLNTKRPTLRHIARVLGECFG